MSGFFGGGGTAYSNFTGSSTSVAGASGLIPAPAAGKNTRGLFSDASFAEIPLFPQYKNTATGAYIGMWNPYQNNGGGFSGAKVRNFMPVYVPSAGQVDKLSYYVAGAGTPAVNCHIAMWECGEDGIPSTYVIGGTGSTGTTASTIIDVSVTATNIVRGFYYLSLTAETQTNVTIRTSSQPFFLESFVGSNSVAGQGSRYTFYYTATTYNQTTHETFTVGSPANTMFPCMSFQYV
jgi:hypothetical protein